jgi:hydrogenase nickel incorporation protein HypA/HybF
MHEYSLIHALLEQVEGQARAHGATAVRQVVVRVGELSGVEPDLLSWAFETLREGTLCERARLELEPIGARWECAACGHRIAPGGPLFCPACGAAGRLVAGQELVLQRVELEVAD